MRKTRIWISLALVGAVATMVVVSGCGGDKKTAAKAPGAVVMDQASYEHWEIALVEMRIE